MHMPFCTVADKCLRCDHVRAGREIKRLREVLRVTMDELIAERDEVKDLNAKYAHYESELVKLQTLISLGKKKANKAFKALYELQLSVMLAKKGKITVSSIKIPPEDAVHYEKWV